MTMKTRSQRLSVLAEALYHYCKQLTKMVSAALANAYPVKIRLLRSMDATLIALKIFRPAGNQQEISHPDEVWDIYKPFKRNNMAKACIEGAVWDLYAKKKGITLAAAMGGKKKEVDVGVSLGLEDTDELLLERIGEKVEEGYKRIKVKIKPGRDVEMVGKIREVYPDIPLMVDANSAYTLDDIDTLKALDEYNLMMIEQPLMAGDIIDHAKLQKQIKTPVCLDESIDSYESAAAAIEMGSCKLSTLRSDVSAELPSRLKSTT